jgi:hypothetical protein
VLISLSVDLFRMANSIEYNFQTPAELKMYNTVSNIVAQLEVIKSGVLHNTKLNENELVKSMAPLVLFLPDVLFSHSETVQAVRSEGIQVLVANSLQEAMGFIQYMYRLRASIVSAAASQVFRIVTDMQVGYTLIYCARPSI